MLKSDKLSSTIGKCPSNSPRTPYCRRHLYFLDSTHVVRRSDILAGHSGHRYRVRFVDGHAGGDLPRTTRVGEGTQRIGVEHIRPQILLRLDLRILLQPLGDDPHTHSHGLQIAVHGLARLHPRLLRPAVDREPDYEPL